MSDFEQIMTLIGRLGRAFDENDWVEFGSCWEEAGVLNWVEADFETSQSAIRGRDQIIDHFATRLAKQPSPSRHFVSLPVIDFAGDEATVRYYTIYPFATQTPALPGFGAYRTQVRRQADGSWKVVQQNLNKISATRTDVAFALGLPVAG